MDKIQQGTRIILITGTEDDNTRPTLAQDYAEAAKAEGLEVEVILVEGQDHGAYGLQSEITKSVGRSLLQ